ncbi:LOW QUALITY PROTEIN: phytanoyl-CoA dioxygenase domain-containing protein 1-like [Uloborus diversus]|uniref:LOW QUALITY PROTEIN: phytanoyl-CoA dioxygenase domain-containing protein 1-like n=1 Tax=Uloborus diversus TaxID=327109 RepID=UPI002409595D|nr:LOW QUALITY PROTEIN: phytanoyl-CoA dioxygenase domain-containing protein 1-like [Uloborus diversus]
MSTLHWWQPRFKRISFSNKIKELLRQFHYKDPVVAHSQLIFKKPEIGEVFRPHQDSTFLCTEPQLLFGIWIPLEDATIENGCLWFIPGSHNNEVFQRFVRNPGNTPIMSMKGKIPEMDDNLYVPVPAKKGDLVLIHGSVLHKSGKNNSNKAHIAYTYHVVERDAEWSKDNWLQPTERLIFPSVYAN